MKKFKFTGQPGEKLHKEDIQHVAWGLDFSKGVTVEVTDENVIKKLSANSHYTEVQPRKTKET